LSGNCENNLSFSLVSFHSKESIHFLIPAIPSGAEFLQPGKPCGSVSSESFIFGWIEPDGP
jgi:hypothetical protein